MGICVQKSLFDIVTEVIEFTKTLRKNTKTLNSNKI